MGLERGLAGTCDAASGAGHQCEPLRKSGSKLVNQVGAVHEAKQLGLARTLCVVCGIGERQQKLNAFELPCGCGLAQGKRMVRLGACGGGEESHTIKVATSGSERNQRIPFSCIFENRQTNLQALRNPEHGSSAHEIKNDGLAAGAAEGGYASMKQHANTLFVARSWRKRPLNGKQGRAPREAVGKGSQQLIKTGGFQVGPWDKNFHAICLPMSNREG